MLEAFLHVSYMALRYNGLLLNRLWLYPVAPFHNNTSDTIESIFKTIMKNINKQNTFKLSYPNLHFYIDASVPFMSRHQRTMIPYLFWFNESIKGERLRHSNNFEKHHFLFVFSHKVVNLVFVSNSIELNIHEYKIPRYCWYPQLAHFANMICDQ